MSNNTDEYKGIDQLLEELKSLELLCIKSQKKEAIGTMALGIVHDFRNILSIILSNTETLLFLISEQILIDKEYKEKTLKIIENILKTIERGEKIINQINDFQKKEEKKKKGLIFLCDLLDELLVNLKKKNPDLKIIKTFESTCIINGYEMTMSQVIHNIFENSIFAMGKNTKKILTIETKPYTIDNIEYCLLSVTDNGCGMSKEVLKKMYDLYFTTKKNPTDHGVGLYFVKETIEKQFGGFLEAESSPLLGTILKIYLPI